MKILQLITDRQLRGAQVFAAQLSDELVKLGHNVVLVSLYHTREMQDMIQAKKAVNIELKGAKKLISISLLLRLREIIIHFSPDVIQANGSDTLKYAVLSVKLSSVKSVVVYRNISMAGSWLRGGTQWAIYRFLFSGTQHVISLTPGTKKEFISVYGYPENRISVIPIGIELPDRNDYSGARRNLEALLGRQLLGPVLLHIGSFSREKNHLGLLRIFKQVNEKVPSSVLLLVGDGVLKTEIDSKVREMNLYGSVHLAGARKDIMQWLSAVEALLLPSLLEGLPGVVLEAMAHQVPVVAYNVGAVWEVIESDSNGIVVNSGDESMFAEKIIMLLEDEPQRRSIGRSAFEKVKETYALQRISRLFEELYRKVMSP